MKTEKALSLSAPEFRKARPSALRGFSVLQLGDEFCANLLPSAADLGEAMERFNGRAVLVTPLLTDEVFDKVQLLIKNFSAAGRRLEIVANDLGLLNMLRGPYSRRVSVSLGRVLSHRVKVMPPGFAAGFLKKHHVRRVELDDPALLPRFETFGVRFSYHLPLRYISTTRFCPWEQHWPGPCSFSCLGNTRRLEHPRLPKPLLLKGQCYGIRGGAAPRHPQLDRVVTQRLPGVRG